MSQTLPPAAAETSSSVVREVVYDETTILNRVGELGRQIESDYRGRDLMVVGILKGAFVFTCDLIRSISSPVGLDFISVSRYHPGRDQGRVRLLKDLQEEIAGIHLFAGRGRYRHGPDGPTSCLRCCPAGNRRPSRFAHSWIGAIFGWWRFPIGYVGFSRQRAVS